MKIIQSCGVDSPAVWTWVIQIWSENLLKPPAICILGFSLCNESYAKGLGALYAYESQVPEVAEVKIDGLVNHYGVRDENGLSFFAFIVRPTSITGESLRRK